MQWWREKVVARSWSIPEPSMRADYPEEAAQAGKTTVGCKSKDGRRKFAVTNSFLWK